jgi:hypothetical protein
VLGGDTHVIEVLSPVEQEVLCNLLRSHVPTLIAMAGRGITSIGVRRDRVGSRWLTASRSHLAARYLASTAPAHLDRVKAELRRRDGVARLDRMDIAPGQTADGTLVVTVRCIDAAASLATARAHAVVLAALALRARRLVREGRRTGNTPQKRLEENRARAIADGLRARFVVENQAGRNRPGQEKTVRQVGARDAVRGLLLDLCIEFANLDTTVEELAPVILPVELPRVGLRRVASEGELFAAWAAKGEATLVHATRGGLEDPAGGGPLLRHSAEAAPGRVSVMLEIWRSNLAGRQPGRDHSTNRSDGNLRDRNRRRQPRDAPGNRQPRQTGDRRVRRSPRRDDSPRSSHGGDWGRRNPSAGDGPPRDGGNGGGTT